MLHFIYYLITKITTVYFLAKCKVNLHIHYSKLSQMTENLSWHQLPCLWHYGTLGRGYRHEICLPLKRVFGSSGSITLKIKSNDVELTTLAESWLVFMQQLSVFSLARGVIGLCVSVWLYCWCSHWLESVYSPNMCWGQASARFYSTSVQRQIHSSSVQLFSWAKQTV